MLKILTAWRHRRHDARLVAKRVRRFAAADILIVSYTKSGRTWLRVLLSKLLSEMHALSDRELIDGDNFHRQQPLIPKIFFAPDTRYPYPELGEAQARVAAQQRVVFLVRDPRDVAVSFFFHVQHRASEGELRRKKVPLSARALTIDAFVRHEACGVPRVLRYLNRWAEERRARPGSLLVRYEDLRADTRGELGRVASYIGLQPNPDVLDRVTSFASFDNLQRMEREGFFASDRLGLTRAGENESAKVRKGKVGGYRDYLSLETIAFVDRLVQADLDPSYGYRQG
jgi:hypothetical protein